MIGTGLVPSNNKAARRDVVERSGYAAVVHKDVVFIGTLRSGQSAQALVAVPGPERLRLRRAIRYHAQQLTPTS